MSQNALYRLDPIADNPNFEGFAFVREESLRGKGRLAWDFGSDNLKTKGSKWTKIRLADIWIPQQVVGRVRSFNDFPCVNLTVPAFSRRAMDALREFLEPNGELLPLVSSVGEYCAYNVITVADFLDQSQSVFQWLGDKRTLDSIYEVVRYECWTDKLIGLTIFHGIEMGPSTVYVTQAFVDRVQEENLKGFHFAKLWPLPKGVSWQEEDKKQRKLEVQFGTNRGPTPIKGHTVVLLFPIANGNLSAGAKELAKVKDEIDGLLYNSTAKPNSPVLGNFEGDDMVEGEMRLFLSCPDADALVRSLLPWLKNISGVSGVKVLKRYGDLGNVGCREEYVKL